MSIKFNISERYADIGLDETFGDEATRMAKANHAIDLGLGMPDFDAYPKELLEALNEVSISKDNSLQQYTRKYGHPRLVNILASLYSLYLNTTVDPYEHILVTVGATEALYCCIFGLINSGDEVLVFDPFYTIYESIIRSAGGIPVYQTLKLSNENNNKKWTIDFNELESKFSDRTRIFLVNTPHNPLGKVFSRQELLRISELGIKYNVIIVMDEVYEWITYDNNKHFRLASIPSMYERSITIGSIGKGFSATGWRIGWAVTGNAVLRRALALSHTSCVWNVATPIQEASARLLESEYNKMVSFRTQDLYSTKLSAMLWKKRNYMFEVLNSLGLEPIAPEGGYCMTIDFKEIINKLDLTDFYDERGISFALIKWLSKNGIQFIPLSAFYSKQSKHLAQSLVRLCFFKSDTTLLNASKVLKQLLSPIDNSCGLVL